MHFDSLKRRKFITLPGDDAGPLRHSRAVSSSIVGKAVHRAMRLDRIARELATAYFLGRGIATDLPAGAMAFLRSPYAEGLPDAQFLFISAPMTAMSAKPPYRMPMAS